MTDTPLKDRLHTMALALDRAGQCNAAVYMQEAADRIEALERALVTAVAALGRVNVTCWDRKSSPLKPTGDIARTALGEIMRIMGDKAYDEIARASLSNIEEDASG